MPVAPRFDLELNEHGHPVSCRCGERCLPPGADGAEDDVRDLREARSKTLPKWMGRAAAQHAWNRKLVA